METSELKQIWQTLAKEKLIDMELAKENIERIITLKSSKTVEKLSKKLKTDYFSNLVTSILIIAITIFATIFLHQRNHQLPIQGYIFLILVFSFYASRSVTLHSKIKLLDLSFPTSSILDSLKKVKMSFEKDSKKENRIIFISLIVLTIYANVLINDKTNMSNFNICSLQGYVLIFSIGYLISLPWVGKFIYKKRFSGIMEDLDTSIQELNTEIE
jgi:hypothetical protein